MELRKSVRGKNAKKHNVWSDDEEEVITKKTRLNSKGTYSKKEQLDLENFGIGKRIRRKNTTFKNYKLDSDSDSDFDAGYIRTRKSGSKLRQKNKSSKSNKEATKVEFLLDWKREIIVSNIPTTQNSYKIVQTKKVLEADLKQYGHDIQALFINIKWRTSQIQNGVKIDDLKKLDLNKKLMKNGIVFIWSEKEILGKLLKIMEEKGFFYIENFVVALLDASKADPSTSNKKIEQNIRTKTQSDKGSPFSGSETSSTTESSKQGKNHQDDENDNEYFLQNLSKYPNLEAEKLLYEGESEYLKISKRVLMMFRRVDHTKETPLELRHQRTCDALFDLVDHSVPYGASDQRTKEYIFKLIETLLPKAIYNPGDTYLRMMELFADPLRPREGWINICEKI